MRQTNASFCTCIKRIDRQDQGVQNLDRYNVCFKMKLQNFINHQVLQHVIRCMWNISIVIVRTIHVYDTRYVKFTFKVSSLKLYSLQFIQITVKKTSVPKDCIQTYVWSVTLLGYVKPAISSGVSAYEKIKQRLKCCATKTLS